VDVKLHDQFFHSIKFWRLLVNNHKCNIYFFIKLSLYFQVKIPDSQYGLRFLDPAVYVYLQPK